MKMCFRESKQNNCKAVPDKHIYHLACYQSSMIFKNLQITFVIFLS